MERREYRAHGGLTIIGCTGSGAILLLGLSGVLGGSLELRHGGMVWVIIGTSYAAIGAALFVEILGERILLVEDDGIHPFRYWRRMEIPWSSVRSIEVGDLKGRVRLSAVWVHLDSGNRFPLPVTQGTRERATRIAEELNDALREHAGGPPRG